MRLDTLSDSVQVKGEVLDKLLDAKMIILVEPGEEWRGLFQSSEKEYNHSFLTSMEQDNNHREDYFQSPVDSPAAISGSTSWHMADESALADSPDEIEMLSRKVSTKYHLTTRETEVISRLLEGCREFSEIASRMEISPKTLRNHMSSIYIKTKTPSIMALYSLLINYLISSMNKQAMGRR